MQRLIERTFLFCIVLVLCRCAETLKPPVADLILLNGQCFTADSRYANATALAIAADTILAVGSDLEMRSNIRSGSVLIERMMVAGS